ncbi:hypothetical protein BLA39750_03051 [Burkholderia lata]|uniref:Uncharacterized protein n=1 Tax=Burkholderia lata (strain ATCC 17760 / DSM 23089 / LMG 22485 / NCIMB 9086 / R18194 / 383) TaxID=482957 RepID=A0A6P2XFS6_BURL3|nr:hypothetical protein BLA39750_03051 [Burkholderia lata]
MAMLPGIGLLRGQGVVFFGLAQLPPQANITNG